MMNLWINFWDTFLKALQTLAHVRPAYALLAVALYAISFVIGGARWKAILSGLGCPSRLRDTSLGILIGIFVNNLTSVGRMGGEISRIALIRKRARINWKRATISILYDRLATVLPVVLLAVLAFSTLRQWLHPWGNYLWIALPSMALLGIFGRKWISRKKNLLASVRIDRKKLGAALGYSTLVWVQDVIRLTIVAAALGVSLNPFQAATLSLVAISCGLLPSLGGFGPTEGGLTATLHLFGVSVETALAITVLERSISYVLGTCAGSIALVALGGMKLLRRSEPLTEPE